MDQTKLLGTISAVSSSVISAVASNGAAAPRSGSAPSAGGTTPGHAPASRLGSFVTILDGSQSIVGTIASVRTESPGGDGFRLSTTPPPTRQIFDILPIGTMRNGTFERGVAHYPAIGGQVFAAEAADLSSIFSTFRDRNFSVGALSQIEHERLYLDPNRFFAKHIALFGSTGSGKSCTTASILQKVQDLDNTHVILLDLHGEYGHAFPEKGNLLRITDLELPYWLMNFDEIVETLIDETEMHAQNQVMVLKEAILDSKRGKNLALKDLITIDAPVYFDFLDVSARMRSLDTERTLGGKEGPFYGQFTRFLVRLESKLTDKRYEFLFRPKVFKSSDTFATLLTKLFALDSGKRITILDLSRVPFDVINVLVSLLGRIIFDFNLWNKARHDFPVLIVFEEAHTYLSMTGKSKAARKTVERIAKEGRKYGVSCMIVSQRPSEISETITAQCNNFIALRLLNPNDQSYVRKLVPDSLANFMDILPTLSQGEAFVIGDAVPIPSRVMFDMPSPTPASGDVKFYEKWQHKSADTNVADVIDNWWKQVRT